MVALLAGLVGESGHSSTPLIKLIQISRIVQFGLVGRQTEMITLAASEARIPAKAFNKVVYGGERLRVEHRTGGVVAIISLEDLELLEYLEDQLDIQEAEAALARMKERGEEPVPLEDVKARLGL